MNRPPFKFALNERVLITDVTTVGKVVFRDRVRKDGIWYNKYLVKSHMDFKPGWYMETALELPGER